MTLLAISNLRIAYGDSLAVHGVSFSVQEGDVFVLSGANGAGKTSILRCISGLVSPAAGSVSSDGQSLLGLRPHQIAALGIAHVPEGRRVFPNLTVQENRRSATSAVGAGRRCCRRRTRFMKCFPASRNAAPNPPRR